MSKENSRMNGHQIKTDGVDIQIPVPWGNVSGKLWGRKDVQPIVAVHGWQDNAGSFDTLAPILLADAAILAIDLPGHGHSSYYPDGQFYYVFWDGVVVLRRIVKHYKWDKQLFKDDFPPLSCACRIEICDICVLPFHRANRRTNRFGVRKGKWWGPKEIQPILALHGRQDNAGSFDTLMPLMPKDVSVLCLDMPGHGFSSHYPKGQSYYVHWDGVTLLRRIVKHFKWTKVKLLGHSLGGAISFLYAAIYPEEVEFVISLDIASPCVRDIAKIVPVTGDNIDKFLKYENLTLDSLPCYERQEMIDIAYDAYDKSITRESAEILMKRGMQPALKLGQYYFSRDVRLKVALLGMITMDLALAYAGRIKCAYLNIRAIPGMKFDEPENYAKILDVIKIGAKRFEYHEVEGTHHVHLNNPERISDIVINFIKG